MAVLTDGAGQAASQAPELCGVAAPGTAADKEPVRGEEPSSLKLTLGQTKLLCIISFPKKKLLSERGSVNLIRSTRELPLFNYFLRCCGEQKYHFSFK